VLATASASINTALMSVDTIKRLCAQLRGLREANGYTQKQAAELAGVSPGRWGQVERGDVSTIDVIERCAVAIGGRFHASIEPVKDDE
jgi:transcriptional regulator with XRE-family HTH domain